MGIDDHDKQGEKGDVGLPGERGDAGIKGGKRSLAFVVCIFSLPAVLFWLTIAVAFMAACLSSKGIL